MSLFKKEVKKREDPIIQNYIDSVKAQDEKFSIKYKDAETRKMPVPFDIEITGWKNDIESLFKSKIRKNINSKNYPPDD